MTDVLQRFQDAYQRGEIPTLPIIAELVDEIGRTVIGLPCAIGAKLYHVESDGILKGMIQEIIMHGYSESHWQGSANMGKDSRFIICHNSYNQPHAYQLKTVFLTRTEAEKAMERSRKNDTK